VLVSPHPAIVVIEIQVAPSPKKREDENNHDPPHGIMLLPKPTVGDRGSFGWRMLSSKAVPLTYEQLEHGWRITAPPETLSRVSSRLLAWVMLMIYFGVVMGRAMRWLSTGSPIYAWLLLAIAILAELALLRIFLIDIRRTLRGERLMITPEKIMIERPALLLIDRRDIPRRQVTDVTILNDTLHIHRRGGGGAYIFSTVPVPELQQLMIFLRQQLRPGGRTVVQDLARAMGKTVARRLK
jgi:hypothetical protein